MESDRSVTSTVDRFEIVCALFKGRMIGPEALGHLSAEG